MVFACFFPCPSPKPNEKQAGRIVFAGENPMNAGELAVFLGGRQSLCAGAPVVAGFDAFVDDVWDVVDCRESPETYDAVATISDFADWAAASAGRSGSRESVLVERAAGGCSINLGDGLMALDFPLHAFVGVGNPPDPAFADFSRRCASLHPAGIEPGRAAVYEFRDGKLMFCSFSHFTNLTPVHFERTGLGARLRESVTDARALVLTSWSVYPHMTGCWEYLQREALAGLPNRPLIFLDVADPASRSRGDIQSMLSALGGFEKIGPAVLSLNLNEANRLGAACDLPPANPEPAELLKLAGALREHTGISEVGIHLVDRAVSASASGAYHVTGPYCANPRKSVGAGDRFNAGWLAAHLLDLPPEASLLFASAVSGFFVRNARSGSFPEILEFLKSWHVETQEATQPNL
jgi:hypothetical protein